MARRFGELEFVDLTSGVHRLTKVKVDSVDSVDRGAGVGTNVVLTKRFAGWMPPEWWAEQKEREMQKNAHSSSLSFIKELTDMVRRNEVGKSVASVRAKAFHDEHLYDPYRKNEKGRVLSDHQQFAHAMAHHPIFKALGEAMAQGNELTADEMEKEFGLKGDLDAAHARQRELGSGHDGRNQRPVTKQTVSSICNAEIDRMAKELVKRARSEKGIVLSVAKAWEIIINGTPKGAALNNLEKFSRIGI